MTAGLWIWRPDEPRRLAEFVVHHLFTGHRLLPSEIMELRRDPFLLAGRLYEGLRAEPVWYDVEPFNPNSRAQVVRQPHSLLLGQQTGNCLDLSLLYAGLCAAAHLRPLIAVFKPQRGGPRHALVLIPRCLGNAGDQEVWGDLPVAHGLSEPTSDQLSAALEYGLLTAVELTAITQSRGRLGFGLACVEGAKLLGEATGIVVVDPVHLQKNDLAPRSDALSLYGSSQGNPAFGPTVRAAFAARLGADPVRWDLRHLGMIQTVPGTEPHHTLAALVKALRAKEAFEAAGGRRPEIRRLQGIYYRAIGRDSEGSSAEVLLVEAAAADLVKDGLSGLARFVLGVAAGQGTGLDHQVLKDWLADQDVQEGDARRHLLDCQKITHWALIWLGEESQDLELTWPRTLSITLDPPVAGTRPLERVCPSEAELPGTLSQLLGDLLDLLPDSRKLVVDLVAPRRLLDRRIEHWGLIQDGPRKLALSPRYEPRLRWSHHLLDKVGRGVQADRDQQADWGRSPKLVPAAKAGDEERLTAWLESRQARSRPCLIGGRTDGGGDPLLWMLLSGYGFILWYADSAAAAIGAPTMRKRWRGVKGVEARKREVMPERLTDGLRDQKVPVVIWNDLRGRGGSTLAEGRLQSPSGGNAQ